ncbi:MAG: hypothetical protein IPI59_03365 [Sphingobacteriales bacterium]|jgi:hypothetical protein|nr:hypothetical protein [Sphingobacteriales bacterium]MBP9142771.1 hypothetical protein [Chitinophagales bacterium]MDA0199871.1 hypothetical protein [Bacteroidota bacterium]MBK6890349.1 hypothetical protein [Sphingobacteriales bacterium]MBK7526597.1 hypothetical protein [Sphingobacteriales bacterium]
MKLRSLLVVLMAILVGFALGVFVAGRFLQAQVNEVVGLDENSSLPRKLAETLQLSPQQAEQVKPLAKTHHKAVRQMRRTFIQQREARFDSLMLQLQPILTETQQQKLNNFKQQRIEKRLQQQEKVKARRLKRGLPVDE